jgi:small-conductance mechanosensitive channel
MDGVLGLVIALLLAVLVLWLAVRLLRASWHLLRNVFSHDRSVLRRRLLIGLGDLAYAFFVGFFFFSGEMGVPAVQIVLAWICLIVFVTGLAVLLLAALQLIGLAFSKEKKSSEPPAQSSP